MGQHGGWEPGLPKHLREVQVPGSRLDGGRVSPVTGGEGWPSAGVRVVLAQGSARLNDAGGRDSMVRHTRDPLPWLPPSDPPGEAAGEDPRWPQVGGATGWTSSSRRARQMAGSLSQAEGTSGQLTDVVCQQPRSSRTPTHGMGVTQL